MPHGADSGLRVAAGGADADAAILQQLWLASAAGSPLASGASPVSPLPALEQIYAVVFADSPNPRSPQAYEASGAARLRAVRRLRAGGGLGRRALAQWPRAAAQDRCTGPWNRPTAHTILLIANTTDPATPYAESVAMSRDLASARLLTVGGYGHTEFTNPSTCATGYAVRYPTTGALPAAGTVCPQNGTPFGASSQEQS